MHIRSCYLSLLTFLLSVAATHALTDGPYTYTVSTNGEATITDFSLAYSGHLSITNSLGGYPVTSIGYDAFYDHDGLTSVTFGGSIRHIGERSFWDCDSLTDVTFGTNVTSIADWAFAKCYGISTVTIPSGLTNLSQHAFHKCFGLTSILVQNGNPAYSSPNGVLLDATGSTLIAYPAGRIGSYAVPLSISTIGNGAFMGCTSLTNVTVGSSVVEISSYAFAECLSLTDMPIGTNVTVIPAWAFWKCHGLTSVTIPNGITNCSQYAFAQCDGLTNIFVEVGNQSYSSLDGVLFDSAQTTLIVFPSGRTGSYSIPDTVVGIGESAFYVCYGLTNVTIGSGIIDIGIKAFWECDGLVDVTFGSNIATIADWAFGRCDGLRSVTVGIGVTNCDPRAFAECPGLTNILVQNGNPSYSSLNGVLLDSSQTTLVTFPGGRAGSYTIPEAIETIEHNAFYGCALSGITIGNDVTSIGREAFFDSDNLTSVVISDSVSTIGYRAFGFCDNLDNVYFTGDAPANCNPAAFSGSPNVGVYYMPGTTGWSATFAGVSAYLWNPAFSGLAAHGSNVSCVVTGTPSIPVELESTTNLLAGSWVSLRTTNLTGGSVSLSDTNEITHPTRFYRIVGP